MDASKVGFKYYLRQGEGQDCDGRNCNSNATVRITEAASKGVSFGYYCKDCIPDPVPAKEPATS